MKNYSNSGWFKNISISKKLYFAIGVMALLIAIELLTLLFSINTLSSVRAFVGAEGLWSKGQKDAVYNLRKYARSGHEEDYEAFRYYMKVPLGDRKTRIEMGKSNPNITILRKGFIEGRNHPDDVDGMIKLFRRFHNISYIHDAIVIWAQADSSISQMQKSAEQIHTLISLSGISSPEKTEENLNTINEINKKLTVLEDAFSSTLGEGSRWLENLILRILLIIAITVEVSGLWLTISISRNISKGIKEIIRVSEEVGKGIFKTKATIYSGDEIGQLASSFNKMISDLERKMLEKEQAEIQIKEREEQIKTIFENAPEAVVVINQQEQIIQWNPRAEAIFGWKAEEVTGKHLHEIIIPHRFREAHLRGFKHFLTTHEGPVLNKPVELPALRKDNTEFDAGISISPTVFKGDYFFIGFINDISYRKTAEKKLKESEEKFYSIFHSSSVSMSIVRLSDNKFIEVNKKFIETIGFTKEEITGKTIAELGIIVTLEIFNDFLKTIKKTGATLDFELSLRNKSGAIINVLVSMTVMEINGEKCIVANYYDITEKKQIEVALQKKSEELEHSNKELEHFAYVASHDLQEPLRTIINYVGLFRKRYIEKLDPNSDEFLNFISEATKRMQTLIKDLLDYSRIGVEKNIIEIDCNKLLGLVLTDMSITIENTKCQIKWEVLPVIYGYQELRSLFQNLISNAIKYRKKDIPCLISISAKGTEKEWLFSFKDNGIGIDPKYHERVFIIFQKLHSQKEYEGTGIGLTQCKKIVELHGGKIWLESELGKGSTFYFTIPKTIQL